MSYDYVFSVVFILKHEWSQKSVMVFCVCGECLRTGGG